MGFLAVVPSLLRRFDVDATEMVAAAGLQLTALDDPEGTIPYAAMGSLMAAIEARTGCAHFGLLVGAHIKPASLGRVGALMQNAPTLGEALKDFAAHQHRNAHGGVAYLLPSDDRVIFGYAIYQPRMTASVHIYDGAAAAAFNIVTGLIGRGRTQGMAVLISRERPVDVAPYESFFGAPIQFDSSQTGVTFPSAWLDLPVLGANPVSRAKVEREVAGMWLAGDLDVVTRLRRLLRIEMFGGHPADDVIAAKMGLSQRTLRRNLAAAGVSFKTVLDELRAEAAQQLLANTRLNIGEVGAILRYFDPAIFTRAFVRWTGTTPMKWRAALDVGQ